MAIPTMRGDPLGRGPLVLSNLLRGDLRAAARAGLTPDELSPEEARTLAQQMGHGEGFFGHVLDGITNPIVIIGAMLSLRFPVPSAKNALRVRKEIENARLDSWFPMWMRQLAHDPVSMFKHIVGKKGSRWEGETLISEPLKQIGASRRQFQIAHVEDEMVVAYDRFQKTVGRRPNGLEKGMVVAELDGQLKVGAPPSWRFRGEKGALLETPFDIAATKKWMAANPATKRLAQDMRAMDDSIFDELLLSDPEMRVSIQKAMWKQGTSEARSVARRLKKLRVEEAATGIRLPNDLRRSVVESAAFKSWHKKMVKRGMAEPGERIGDHWVHTMSDVDAQFAHDMDSLLEMAGGDAKIFGKMAAGDAAAQASKNLRTRMNRMLPDPEGYKVFEGTGLLDDAKMAKFQKRWEQAALDVRKDGRNMILPYTMDLEKGTVSYINRMSNTFALNKGQTGQKLEEGRKILREVRDTELLGVLENTVLPLAMGKQDLLRASKSMYMAGLQRKVNTILDRPELKNLAPIKWMKDRMAKNGSWFAGVESEFTGFLYGTTLGLPNIASPALNALQTALTTAPLIGLGNTMKGLTVTIKKIPQYYKNRTVGKMSHIQAMEKTFPDFVSEGFGGTFRISDLGLDEAFRKVNRTRFGKKFDQWNEMVLNVFEKTETMNQLTAFYGGKAWARASGVAKKGLNSFAASVVDMTQFPGSLANTIIGVTRLKGLPGGKLAAMFSQFGLKYAQFVLKTGVTVGARESSWLGKYNLGTLGRSMLTSGLIYEVGQSFGKNMSQALIFGAMPAPFEGKAFYPFPFVSPTVGMAGSAVMGLMEGDLSDLQRQLPVLVPGGIGAARLSGLVSPSVAQAVGRRYVDWDRPGPNGTFPVYSPGRGDRAPSLVGNMTPWQITMDVLGLPGGGIAQREAETAKWILSQRDRMLSEKRAYMEAVDRADMRAASGINEAFKQAYPQIRGGITGIIQERDWEAIVIRRNVPRLEKILDTLPANARQPFAAAIQQTLLGMSPDLMGVDPRLLTSSSTFRSRRPGMGRRPGTRGRKSVFGAQFRGSQGFQRNQGGYSSGGQVPDPGSIAAHSLPNVYGF